MARISEQTIEHIRSTVDILDVIGRHVQLKKRGQNYFGLCPFHLEKTPSFAVNPGKQIYKCFGCGAGGGSINFIMAVEKLEFIEAIKSLGDQYGIEVDINAGGKAKNLTTQLFELQNIAAEHYQNNLKTSKGKLIIKYLHSRGITDEIILRFKIGYSNKNWTSLLNKARKLELNSSSMIQSGLFINGEKGYFDRFRNRIMFPIKDRHNKIIAFAGRTFEGDDPAKYINSSETPIYNKSAVLYGLSDSKKYLTKQNVAIIVEGYLDYLQLYQAGIKNVAAVSGTAFTDSHAIELKKYVQTVKIAYDGDKAGKSAAIRAGYVLLKNGFSPEIISLPDGMDPDDWIQKSGSDPFLDAVDNSLNLFQFQFDNILKNKQSPNTISTLVNEILFELSLITDPIHRELNLKELAKVSKLNEHSLYESLTKLLNKKYTRGKILKNTSAKTPLAIEQKNPLRRLEGELIQICFSDEKNTRKFLYEFVDESWLQTKSIRKIYTQIYIHLNSKFPPDINVIMDGLKDQTNREKLASLVFNLEQKNLSINSAIECLKRMEKYFLKKQIENLRDKIKENGSSENMSSFVNKIATLQQSLLDITQKYQEYSNV